MMVPHESDMVQLMGRAGIQMPVRIGLRRGAGCIGGGTGCVVAQSSQVMW